MPAPAAVAERLGIEPGTPVLVRRRTTVIEDRPNQLADSYYPLDVAADAAMLREEKTGLAGASPGYRKPVISSRRSRRRYPSACRPARNLSP